MYLGGPTFELGGPTFESRVGPIFGRGVLENTPIPLLKQILNSSPMGVFSRDYGSKNVLRKIKKHLAMACHILPLKKPKKCH